MEIDLPQVMDVLRGESLKLEMVHPKARDIVSFHESFIDTIHHFGRMWELGLIAEYKLRTRHFWQDVVLAPLMLKKGILALRPSFDKTLSSRIFSNLKRQGDKPK
jgi:heterodisulfide reductase subunit C